MKRADRLKKVSETLDLERNLAGKGRRIKVTSGTDGEMEGIQIS